MSNAFGTMMADYDVTWLASRVVVGVDWFAAIVVVFLNEILFPVNWLLVFDADLV